MWCMEETKEGKLWSVRACETGTGRTVREMEKGRRERVGKRVGRRERRVSNTGYQYLHAFEHVHGILIRLRDSIDQVKHRG